jgi:hypothetical protein
VYQIAAATAPFHSVMNMGGQTRCSLSQLLLTHLMGRKSFCDFRNMPAWGREPIGRAPAYYPQVIKCHSDGLLKMPNWAHVGNTGKNSVNRFEIHSMTLIFQINLLTMWCCEENHLPIPHLDFPI